MPRGPRLDAPGALHHVIARGIERRDIFRGDGDRRRCLDRLGAVVMAGGGRLYAWCLMPNHVHALIRSGSTSLSLLMRRWLGPYASSFNRRYQRAGHLFQNRFKSILVEEDAYFFQLVRYIHLNPIRAHLCESLDDLDSYAWTGHAVLVGQRAFSEQDTDAVLAQFGVSVGAARCAYREFVRAGLSGLNGAEVGGGGLRRSASGWAHVSTLQRGREGWAHDERVLGSAEFVQMLLASPSAVRPPVGDPGPTLTALCESIAPRFRVTPAQIASRSIQHRVLAARAVVCHVAVCHRGLSLYAVARCLGISKQSVTRAVDRAVPLIAQLPDWQDILRNIDAES